MRFFSVSRDKEEWLRRRELPQRTLTCTELAGVAREDLFVRLDDERDFDWIIDETGREVGVVFPDGRINWYGV